MNEIDSYIKTHGIESQGQEEAACARVFKPVVSYLHVAEL